jgi:regulator of sigma E protease
MPDILLVILAVIFVLGIAINIHEFGHFIVAKFFGMRVEAYSFFGLGPRVWGFKVGHTDYRISAIPLGAYVKLYGDEATAALEGGESEGEKVPDAELYELRPRWQKFLVMLGGPFMNIVLALGIPFAGAMMYGVPAIPDPMVSYVAPGGAAEKAGLKVGDKIVSFEGEANPTWRKIETGAAISPDKPLPLIVERAGAQVPLTITPTRTDKKGQPFGEVDMKPEVGIEQVMVTKVDEGSAALAAGMQARDRIVSINGETITNSGKFMTLVQANKDTPMTVVVEREGQQVPLQMTAASVDGGQARIGIALRGVSSKVREPATIGQSASFAVNANYEIIALTGRVFGQLFSGQRAVKDAGLAGPVGIVGIISQVVTEDGFVGLFSILAVISLNLGVFNLLPIPLLDGGQIMVLGIEKVLSWFGRTLSMAWKERIQLTGLAVILLLMAFTLFLDVSKFF